MRMKGYIFFIGVLTLFPCSGKLSVSNPNVNDVRQAIDSRRDLWGEVAMSETNGASYEFFEKLLPPPRYVNADFHHYPIVLSAPCSTVKARLISDGSGINIKGGARSWRDTGTPFKLRVGTDEFLFGSLDDDGKPETLKI